MKLEGEKIIGHKKVIISTKKIYNKGIEGRELKLVFKLEYKF